MSNDGIRIGSKLVFRQTCFSHPQKEKTEHYKLCQSSRSLDRNTMMGFDKALACITTIPNRDSLCT